MCMYVMYAIHMYFYIYIYIYMYTPTYICNYVCMFGTKPLCLCQR